MLVCAVCGGDMVEVAPRDYVWLSDSLVEVKLVYGCPNLCGQSRGKSND